MLKKTLSVLLTALMVASLVMVPAMGVSANVEQVDITDYEPYLTDNLVGLTPDLVDTNGSYGVTAADLGNGKYSVTAGASQSANPSDWVTYSNGLQYYVQESLEKDIPYVVMVEAKKISAGDGGLDPKLLYGVTSESGCGYDPTTGKSDGSWQWLAQYTQTKEITSAEYEKIGTVITFNYYGFPADYKTTSGDVPNYTRLKIGLGVGNANYKVKSEFRAGTSVEVDSAKTYIAPERVYDVQHELSSTEVLPGSVITANAKVVNQMGDTSSYDQTLTMYATDTDGNVVPNTEIAISTPDANGDYTITVGAQANGEYVILARSIYTDGDKLIQSAIPLTVDAVDYSDADASVTGFVDYITGNGTDAHDWGVSSSVTDGMVTFTSAPNQNGLSLAHDQFEPCDGWYWGVNYLNESAANDEWVISFRAKKLSEDTDANVIYGMTHAAAKWSVWSNNRVYTETLNDSEWHTIEKTFTLPADGHSSYIRFQIGLGFGNTVYTSIKGDLYAFQPNASVMIDVDSIYVGKSTAKNSIKGITNTAPVTKVFAGNSISAQADVINALGSKGTLDQTIDFAILDAATRTQPISGITVTKGENGAYTINVGESVAEGTYVAVASNTTNGTIVRKGLEFTVESLDKYKTDHIATDIPSALNKLPNYTPGADGKFGITSAQTAASSWKYRVSAATERTQTPGNDWQNPVVGLRWDYSQGDLAKGTTYVLKVKARNANAEKTPYIAMALMSGSGKWISNYVWSEEVSSTEWQEITKTFTYKHDSKNYTSLHIGLGAGSTFYDAKTGFAYIPGAEIDIDQDSYYFAPEAAYDVEVTPSASNTRAGTTITVDASVINQVGMEGTLSQNFTWAPLNAARTAVADGITITSVADSTKVNVAFDADVAEGTYVIAAYSEDYEMAKSVVITISDKASVENVVVNTESKTVTFDALNVAEEGFKGAVYVAEYVPVSEIFVKAEKIPFTLTAGNTEAKEVTYTLVPTEGNELRVYIWDDKLTPYILPIVK